MSTADHRPDRLADALEVALYAPLGLGLFLRDAGPGFVRMLVARGRSEVDRRQEQVVQQVRHTRAMGEVALAFGLPQVRKNLATRVESVRARAGALARIPAAAPPVPGRAAPAAPSAPTAPSAPSARAGEEEGPVGTHAASTNGDDPGARAARRAASAGLPIPGYDALSASQVVERLAGLAPEELAAVRAYEAGHRNRRTILGKIDQLAG